MNRANLFFIKCPPINFLRRSLSNRYRYDNTLLLSLNHNKRLRHAALNVNWNIHFQAMMPEIQIIVNIESAALDTQNVISYYLPAVDLKKKIDLSSLS